MSNLLVALMVLRHLCNPFHSKDARISQMGSSVGFRGCWFAQNVHHKQSMISTADVGIDEHFLSRKASFV
jgi:hypothetical protein